MPSSWEVDGQTPQQKQKVVIGQYVSVERCRVLKTADGENGKVGDVVWDMATASDAKGWLPMAVQKLGVPGAVVKDVGFFMKWIHERRSAGAMDGPKVTNGGTAP